MSRTGFDISNPALAEQGDQRIEWALQEMPVLRELAARFSRERPLQGIRMSGCLHITTETANLALTLKAAGADLVLCASNPLSTQDDVAAALAVRHEIPVYAIRGESTAEYYRHINAALDHQPVITMDDGAGNHHRRNPPACHGAGRRAQIPGHRRQRCHDQAFV
jgi:adenosylhomocysteinase